MKPDPTISRRNMMVASGAVVAGLSCSSALADSGSSEIEAWQSCIGQRFTVGRARSLRSVNQRSLQLVDVQVQDFEDPHRPAEFRQPFTLIFKRGRNTQIEDGCHLLTNADAGRQTVFLNEILDLDYGDQPVFQAVFN